MERKAFKEKAKQQIHDISKEIESLNSKMKIASERLKLKYQEALVDFKEKRDELEANMKP
jgi:hypothetical protein